MHPTVSPLRLFATRVVLALVIVSGTSAFGLGGGYWAINHKFNKTKGVDIAELDDKGPARNFLIIGSDSRAFVDDTADQQSFGNAKEVGGQRADVIIIARVDPKTKHGILVSIPRDTEVNYKGHVVKINSTFEGGPGGIIAAIKANFNVDIQRYIKVDFAGFRNAVTAIGGVKMYIPYPERDKKTGLDIRTPGCQTLDGKQALAYVRSRYFEYKETGRWRSDPTGDIGRIQRQQDFIRRVMQQSIHAGIRNPLKANHLADVVLPKLEIDNRLSFNEVGKLARTFKSFDPASVEMVTIPTESAPFSRTIGSALRVKEPDAQQVFAKLRGQTLSADSTGVLLSSVRVQVLNGSGVPGQATDTLSKLQDVGFTPAGSGDAPNYRFGTTKIRYAPAALSKARVLARYLNGVGQLVEDPTIRSVDVILVTGPDFKGVSDKPGQLPAATPTTALPSTPSTTAKATGANPQPNC